MLITKLAEFFNELQRSLKKKNNTNDPNFERFRNEFKNLEETQVSLEKKLILKISIGCVFSLVN